MHAWRLEAGMAAIQAHRHRLSTALQGPRGWETANDTAGPDEARQTGHAPNTRPRAHGGLVVGHRHGWPMHASETTAEPLLELMPVPASGDVRVEGAVDVAQRQDAVRDTSTASYYGVCSVLAVRSSYPAKVSIFK
jgi:hypothetical protein